MRTGRRRGAESNGDRCPRRCDGCRRCDPGQGVPEDVDHFESLCDTADNAADDAQPSNDDEGDDHLHQKPDPERSLGDDGLETFAAHETFADLLQREQRDLCSGQATPVERSHDAEFSRGAHCPPQRGDDCDRDDEGGRDRQIAVPVAERSCSSIAGRMCDHVPGHVSDRDAGRGQHPEHKSVETHLGHRRDGALRTTFGDADTTLRTAATGDQTAFGTIATVIVVPWHDESGDEEETDDGRPPLLPPEDRVWRHPSELFGVGATSGGAIDAASRSRRTRPRALLALSVAVGAMTFGALLLAADMDEPTDDARRTTITANESLEDGRSAIDSSVFGIRVRRGDQWVRGSSTVYRRDGYLLTTRRLVLGGDEVHVDLGSLGELPAKVVGTDAHTDLAVLYVGIPDLGSSPRWAEPVLGAPISIAGLQAGGQSSSISGTIRVVGIRQRSPDGTVVDGMVGTDVAVPREMTGGALLDDDGAIVGLVNAMFQEDGTSDGVPAVAAPVAVVAAEAMVDSGKAAHAWMGVEVTDLAPDNVAAMGRGGVVVQGVVPDGPAADALVESGDVLVTVAGDDVSSTAALLAVLRRLRVGDTIDLVVIRDGVEHRLEVKLAAKEDDD